MELCFNKGRLIAIKYDLKKNPKQNKTVLAKKKCEVKLSN